MIELAIYITLTLINGFFAMTEIALVVVNKNTLKHLAKTNKSARKALDLSENPNNFLITIQIAITMIGILVGTIGSLSFIEPISSAVSKIQIISPYSQSISIIIMTLISTYIFLVFGELVPKRIALNNPIKISVRYAALMILLSKIFTPAHIILNKSVNLILKILNVKHRPEPPVSDQDVLNLLSEGMRTGAFLQIQKNIVENTLKIGDLKVRDYMVPLEKVFWLDLTKTPESMKSQALASLYEEIPVSYGELKTMNLKGVIKIKDLLKFFIASTEKERIEDIIYRYRIINQDEYLLKAIPLFKDADTNILFVNNDSSELVGIISTLDVLEAVGGI